MTTNNKKLIEFLNELVESIEKHNIKPEVLKEIGEFYMKIKFNDDYSKKEDKEMIKYLSLGYYIYNNIEEIKE